MAIGDSPDVLVCRLVDGKVTFVHRRLWPALARAERRFPRDRLTRIREQHTASGAHVVAEARFPDWLPAKMLAGAAKLDLADALRALGTWHR